jgi:hypothetical protein
MKEIFIRIEAAVGSSIEDVVVEICELCSEKHINAIVKFNGIDIKIKCGDDPKVIIARYYAFEEVMT